MASRVASFTGTNAAGSASEASQAGDIFIAFAYRDGNTTAPSLPSGWTNIANTGANTNSSRLAYRVATGTTTAINGTWTNATSVIIVQYRPGSGNTLAVGNNNVGNGSSTTVNYPALSLQDTSGASWVAGFAGHRSVDTNVQNAPSGMTNITSVLDATDEAAAHDTNGGVTSWSSTNVSVGGTSSGWQSRVVEIRENPPPPPGGWDPSHAFTSLVTLSNSNRTATTSAFGSAVSSDHYSVGKRYVEVLWAGTFAGASGIGVIETDLSPQVMYYSNGTTSWGPTLASFAPGDNVSIAIDTDADFIWFRVNGGNWNSDGLADPSAGLGGVSISAGVDWYLFASMGSSTQSATINATSATFAYSKPSGFSDWYEEASGGPTGYEVDADSGSYSVTGQTANLKVGRIVGANEGSYALSGTDATLRLGRPVVADPGSYSLTGSAASLAITARLVAADPGSYALTGSDAGLARTSEIDALPGSYGFDGQTAALSHGYYAAAEAGSYGITGSVATLLRDVRVTAEAGSYTISGQPVAMLANKYIEAAAGSYSITGTEAGLILQSAGAYEMMGEAGSYSLTGTAASLLSARVMTADGSSYSLTGQPATLRATRLLVAANGNYQITGSEASVSVGTFTAPRRGGDDAPVRQRRKYRHVTARQLQQLLSPKEDVAPKLTHKRRRVIKREIVEAVEAGGLLGPVKPQIARFVEQQIEQFYVPEMNWGELARAVEHIMRKAAEEAARIEQEIEDEDEMILLMVA